MPEAALRRQDAPIVTAGREAGLGEEGLRRLRRQAGLGAALDRHAAHLEEEGRGEGGDVGGADVLEAAAAAGEHLLDAAEVDEAAAGLGAGDAEQEVAGVVLAQGVVEDVGGEGGLAAGLAPAGEVLLDQAGDGGGGAEGALHHRVLAEPALEAVAQAGGVEERGGVGDLVEAPDQQRVVVGDEAHGVEAGGLHAAGEEEAEGLVGVAAGEAVEAEVLRAGRGGRSRRAACRGGGGG